MSAEKKGLLIGAKPKAVTAVKPKVAKPEGKSVVAALEALDQARGNDVALPVDDVIPNDWNPNKMTPAMREKVANGLLKLIKAVGVERVPGIIVRKHPTRSGKWQIIDGFHRWDLFREWKQPFIKGLVIDVDDGLAIELTSALNYNRGEPDPDEYAPYLKRYLDTTGYTYEEAERYLPESKDEMEQIITSYELTVEHIDVGGDEDEDQDGRARDGADALIELKFVLHKDAAEVVEAEVARIGGVLTGKNIRGRALEMICANSAGTPLEAFDASEQEVEEETRPSKVSDTKNKLKKKAVGQ